MLVVPDEPAVQTGGPCAPDVPAVPKSTSVRRATVLAALVALLFVVVVAALAMGRYAVDFRHVCLILLSQVFPVDTSAVAQQEFNVVLNARLPRVCAAVLVGGALALSGATYQGVFKNPLVSPDILGVSSGACVGAGVAILLHLSGLQTGLFALVGGSVAVLAAVAIPKLFRSSSNLMLVLAGVIVSGFMSSVLALIKYVADTDSELPSIVYWTMGSLATTLMSNVLVIAPAMIAAAVILILLRWRINLLSLGERGARSLGVNVGRVRGLAILCATVLTACAICLSGTIGWVGLVIPHFARMAIGQDNVYAMPASMVLGSAFMVVIDTAARNITGAELPLGILTGIIGAPLFIYLLARERFRPS